MNTETEKPPASAVVDYSEVKNMGEGTIGLEDGKQTEWNADDGRRRVSLWREVRHKEGEGFRARLERPLPDGSISRLEFSMSKDAALALYYLIGDKISMQNAKDNRSDD